MTNPHVPNRMSATVKVPESKRYAADNPWLVFEGTPASVRDQIIEAFGLEQQEGLTVFDVLLNAQLLASSAGAVSQGLGGRVIKDQGSESGSIAGNSAPEGSAEEKPKSSLFERVEEQGSRAELKALWAANKAEFDADPELMAAWKARGKSLSS
jgi:hypothetical protein